MSGLICAGDLYFDRQDANGKPTGLLLIGNATQFQLEAKAKNVQRTSKQKATYGQVLDTVYLPDPATLDITIDEIDTDNLAIAFLGDNAKDSGVGGTVSAETVTLLATGRGYALKHYAVSAVSVTDHTTPATTYTVDTDYTVNDALGTITPVSGGALDTAITASNGAGVAVDVDYTWAAGSGNIVSGQTQSVIRGRWVLDGTNKANGQAVIADVSDASMSPNGGVDFLSDSFVPLKLTGIVNTPAGATTPFTVRVK